MTYKIIINCTDVTNCKFRCKRTTKDVCENACYEMGLTCEKYPNCYFKQLKRKTREYEELQQYHIKCCEEREKECKKLKAENEELKKKIGQEYSSKKYWIDMASSYQSDFLKAQGENHYNYLNYEENLNLYKQTLKEIERCARGCLQSHTYAIAALGEYLLQIINEANNARQI